MNTLDAIAFYSGKRSQAKSAEARRAYTFIIDAFRTHDFNDAIACIDTNRRVTDSDARRRIYRQEYKSLQKVITQQS